MQRAYSQDLLRLAQKTNTACLHRSGLCRYNCIVGVIAAFLPHWLRDVKSTPELLNFYDLEKLPPKTIAVLYNWLYASVTLLYHARIMEVKQDMGIA